MDSFNRLCLQWWDGFYASFQDSCSMTCLCEDGPRAVERGEVSILLGVGGAHTSHFLDSCGIPDMDAIRFNGVLCRIEALCLPKIVLMYEQYKSSLHLENKTEGMVIDAFQMQDDSQPTHSPSLDSKGGIIASEAGTLRIISEDGEPKSEAVEMPQPSDRAEDLSPMTIVVQSPGKDCPFLDSSSSTAKLELGMVSSCNVNVVSGEKMSESVLSKSKSDEKLEVCQKVQEKRAAAPEKNDGSEVSVSVTGSIVASENESALGKESSTGAQESLSKSRIKIEGGGKQIISCVEDGKETRVKGDRGDDSQPNNDNATPQVSIRRSSRQVRVSAKFADDSDTIRKLIKPEMPNAEDSKSTGPMQCICSTCKAVFFDPAKLRVHWKSHRENKAKKKCLAFFCRLCQQSFASHQKVRVHRCCRVEMTKSAKSNQDPFAQVGPDSEKENVESAGAKVGQGSSPRDGNKVNQDKGEEGVAGSINNATNDCKSDMNLDLTVVPDRESFSCDVCRLEFQTRPLLRNHFLSHGSKPYKCTECAKQFRLKKSLLRHKSIKHGSADMLKREEIIVAADHQGQKRYFCEVCGKGFHRQQSWLNHKRLHDGTIQYECQLCGKTFLDKRSLENHGTVHTGERPHECLVCGKRFRIARGLINHSRLHDKSTHLRCDQCPKTFIEKRSLEAHRLSHSGVKPFACPLCGKTFRRELGLANHARLHDQSKAFRCDVCGRCFVDKWGMLKHKSIHTGEKPFTCSVCGKNFRIKKGLDDHIKLHDKDLQLKCDLCPRTFVEKRKLDIHLRAHRGEKAYVCDQCGQRFINAMTLKVHKRRHTGEKPYSCSFCDKAFNQQGTLIAHERYHKGEKPYVCEVCNEGFVTKSHLTIHRRKHTNDRPYKCQECDYAAFTHSLLRTHMLKHSSEKPFKCQSCPAAFKRPHHLEVHARTHLGGASNSSRLYTCQYCELGFDSEKKLSAHIASHEIVVVTPHPSAVCASTSSTTEEFYTAQVPGEVAYDIVLLS